MEARQKQTSGDVGPLVTHSFAPSFLARWHASLMKLLGGDWSKGDFLAALGLIVAAIGVVTVILAIPGMPKIVDWDSETPAAVHNRCSTNSIPSLILQFSECQLDSWPGSAGSIIAC